MSLLDGYTEEQPKQYKKKKIDESPLLDGYTEPEQQPSFVDNVLQGGVDMIHSIPEATKTFGQGLALGNHRIGAGLGDVLAFAGDKYNIPTLSNYGRTVNEFWGNRANNIQMNPEYEQVKNITNPKMTLPIIANAIGSQGANTAQSLMGGVLGTAMTGGNPVGGVAGALMPNLILEGGYLDKIKDFQNKYGRIPTQEELAKIQNVALAEKGLNSAIETVADRLLFNKIFPNNPVQKGLKELGKRIGKGIVEQGITEGITEGVQEGVSIGAEKLLNLNDKNLKENLGRIGNSAGMGAIGGAFFGGTGGALAQQPTQKAQEQNNVSPVDYAKEVSAKVLDGGKELYNNAVNQPTAFDMMKTLSNNGNYSNIRELAPNIVAKQEQANNDNSLLKGYKDSDTVDKKVAQSSDTVKQSNEELQAKYQEAISKSETQNNLQIENNEKGNTNKTDNKVEESADIDVEKIAPNTDKKQNETNEQKELREMAFDVLSVATGKKKAYLKMMYNNNGNSKSNIKRKEKLEFELGENLNDNLVNSSILENTEYGAYFSGGLSKDDLNYGQNVVDNAIKILNGDFKTDEDLINEYFDRFVEDDEFIQEQLSKNSERLNKTNTEEELINEYVKIFDEWGNILNDYIADELLKMYNINEQRIAEGKNEQPRQAEVKRDNEPIQTSTVGSTQESTDGIIEKDIGKKSASRTKSQEEIAPKITEKQSKIESERQDLIEKAKDLGIKGNLKGMKLDTLKDKVKKAETEVNLNKEIYEGWTVQGFINNLEPLIKNIYNNEVNTIQKPFKNRSELKKWCIDNQPYYKKYIPDVVNYFAQKYNVPNDVKATNKISVEEYINSKPTVEELQQYGFTSEEAKEKLSKTEKPKATLENYKKEQQEKTVKKLAPKTKEKQETKNENIRVGLDENGDLQHYDISDPNNIKKVGEPIYNESTHINNKPLDKSEEIVNNDNTSESEVKNDNELYSETTRTTKQTEERADERGNGISTSTSRIGRKNDNGLLSERGRGLTEEHKQLIEKEYDNQHQLNKSIEKFIENKEYEQYEELPEEIKTWLKKFTGAGGLEKQGAEGKGLLSEYYTPDNVVKKMWELTAQYINTDGARVLEPSVGIGRFLEHAPENTNFDVVEMNPISAKITELLYPNANVKVGQFQEKFIKDNKPVKSVEPEYDIVIGNPPYGEYSGLYKGMGEGKGHIRLEAYFIERGLDTLKENGVMTFIVPSSFLNSKATSSWKQSIAKKGELLEAYRLPEKTFDTTSVGTDIIVIRKKNKNTFDSNMSNGEWFEKNPDKILGDIETRKNRFGKEEKYVKNNGASIDKISANKNEKLETTTNKPTKTIKTAVSKNVKATNKATKKDNKPVEYEEYKADNVVSDEDFKLFKDTKIDGTLPKDKYSPSEKVNQYNGELYNDFNYLQGDIYEKLDALRYEDIPEKQKEIQRKKLESILPKKKKAEEININPTSDFIRNFNTGVTKTVRNYYGDETTDVTLGMMYLDYVRDLSSAERNNVQIDLIRRYINGDRLNFDYKYPAGCYSEEARKQFRAKDKIKQTTNLQNTVNQTFNKFIAESLDENIKEKLIEKWNRNFNNIYNPDYAKMPMIVKGLNSTFNGKKLELQNVQIEGVNFLTNKGAGLLGFEVGVGKTLTGIIATVQNMQMGRCKRPLILVPKQVKDNWIKEINQAFPNITVNDVGNLSKFKGEIENNTLTVATYEALSNIWYDEGTEADLIHNIYSASVKYNENSTKRNKEKIKEQAESVLGKAKGGNKNLFTIQQLGFDHITVDEAHNFKNLFEKAQSFDDDNNVYSGIQGGSQSTRACRLFLATQYILENNNNRNVFLLTATPFNNSPLEVFNMLSYTAKDILDKRGLNNIYQFMENYASMSSDWVVDSKNNVVYKQIVNGFKNVNSLKEMIKSTMLIRSAEDAGIKRPDKYVKTIKLEPTKSQKEAIAQAELLATEKKEDGDVLKAINQSRQATLSPDIANNNLTVSPEDFVNNSPKIKYCLDAIETVLKQDSTTSQILYMPLGVKFLPKIKEYLTKKGVLKSDEIAIVDSSVSDDKITDIVDSFNKKDGKLKLIIGTSKIKEGMNLNKNSSVLYVPYLDWNPTDFQQVVGRIWRRGNKYKKIRVVVPLLKNSSDSFMYQKIQEKSERINALMSKEDVDYIDMNELNTAEDKINMISAPDKKAKMFVQFEEQKLKDEKETLEGRKETTQMYQRKLSSAKGEISGAERSVEYYKELLNKTEDKESGTYKMYQDYLKKAKETLAQSKKALEALNKRIERLEIDFDGKDSVESIDKQIADIDVKIEQLKGIEEAKFEEYQKQYIKEQAESKTIEDYIKEFDEETKDFLDTNDDKLNHIGKKTDIFVSETRAKEVQELLAPAVEKLSKVMGIPAEKLKQEVMPNVAENVENGKIEEVVNALKKIVNGSEEETVKNLRNDLGQYGGTNDITFVFGNNKKGIQHIAQKHGNKTLLNVIDTVINGNIKRFVQGNKTVIIGKDNYEAVLSLDEYGNQKTWLLSGWDITKNNKKSSDVIREVSTQTDTTQIKPTFSRQDLGAELSNIITNNSENFNPKQGNKGAYSPKENLIEFFKNADSSTSVHEVGHWLLNTWQKYAPQSKEIESDVNAIRKFVGNKGEEFSKEQHEKFASAFETYIRNGKAKTSKLQEVFNKFKRALRAIYRSLKEIVFKQNNKDTYFTKDDMKDINDLFNRIFTTEKERKYMGIEDVEVKNIKPTNQGKTPDKLYQGVGLSGVKRANEKLTPAQKAQKTRRENLEKAKNLESADNKQVKEYVRQWYASIESDRYDVNKTLNSFINMSNNIAKEYSKKYGQKVTGKMVREIMPFLRERTDIPENLNRPELIKLFNSLDKSQKDRLRKLADDTSSKFDKYYQTYKKLKGSLTEQDIENHMSHIWKKTDKKDIPLLTNYFATRSKYAKERKIPTIFDGINGIELENGETKYYEPQTLDYAEILKSSSDTFIKANSDIILADLVKNMKNEDGIPLVLPSSKAPIHWVELDNPALAKRVYIGNEETTTFDKQKVKVHPDIANTLKTVFDTYKDSEYITYYDKLNSLYKQSQLGFSGFHIVALTESMLGNMGIKRTLKFLNPARIFNEVAKGNWSIYKNDTLAHQAIDDGLQFGATLDIDRGTVEKIVDNASEWVEKIPFIGKALSYLPKTVSALQKANNKILWDYLHNNYKLECYKLLCIQESERKLAPLTQEERREIAHWVNDSFGGQVWENLGITTTGRKTEQRVFLSPDWLRSTTRQFLGLFSNKSLHALLNNKAESNKYWEKAKEIGERWGIGSLTNDIESSSLRGHLARGFWLRSLIYSALLYNVLNALMRMWDKEKNPEYYQNMTAKDYLIYSNSLPNDKFIDKLLPRVFVGRNKDGSERMLRLGKQFREVPEMLENPVGKLGGKLSPNVQLGSQIFTGHTASGFKNYDMFNKNGTRKNMVTSGAKTALKSFVPYSVNSMMTKDKEPSAWSLIAPVSKGMTKTKGRLAYENVYQNGGSQEQIQAIDNKMRQNGFNTKEINKQKKNARTNFVNSHYEKYLKAIESQNDNKIQSARQELVKDKLTPKEISKIHNKAFKEYLASMQK